MDKTESFLKLTSKTQTNCLRNKNIVDVAELVLSAWGNKKLNKYNTIENQIGFCLVRMWSLYVSVKWCHVLIGFWFYVVHKIYVTIYHSIHVKCIKCIVGDEMFKWYTIICIYLVYYIDNWNNGCQRKAYFPLIFMFFLSYWVWKEEYLQESF